VTDVVQLSTTLGSREAATALAAALVRERLAACVQVLGPLRSTYRWKGAVEEAEEWLCLAKTTAERQEATIARVRALHPYEQPEILVTPVTAGDAGYLAWVRRESAPR
jgi:periplasmic divalent cation tolerance protein